MRWLGRRERERRNAAETGLGGYQTQRSSEIAAPGALYAVDFLRAESKNPL
jgi:hypothetical protein